MSAPPTYCEHGEVLDWGDFAPDKDHPTCGTCPACSAPWPSCQHPDYQCGRGAIWRVTRHDRTTVDVCHPHLRELQLIGHAGINRIEAEVEA